MTDAASLINRYFDAELALIQAIWTERDETRYYELLADVMQHVARSARRVLVPQGRGMAKLDDFDPAEAERKLSRVHRRTLFATLPWRHPEEGLIITAYVDDTDTQLDSTPWKRMHLAMDRTPPQFVALEATCSTCQATGERGEHVCEDCGGRGWTGYRGNLDLGPIVNPGPPQLQVPRVRLDEKGQRVLGQIGL